jgi:3-oxoacyl-[acyl-carrier-protein] synthase III
LQVSNTDYGVAAVASYRPAKVVDNDEIVARFGFDRKFLDNKIGIEKRYIAAADETVGDMAAAAAERLFAQTGARRDATGLLVLCTQNPDYKLPTTANLVQAKLGLPERLAAFDINQGCSGYVYGLAVTTSLMQTANVNQALLITSEAYSKVMDPTDRTTVPLFGDGATATLLSAGAPGHVGRCTFGSDGSGAKELIVKGGGGRNPTMPLAGEGALFMNGRAIYNFMLTRVPADVAACLAANGLTHNDIDFFVFHQASRFMIEALTEAMKLPRDRVPVTMADGGNTVSNTIPMALEALGGIDALAGKRLLLSGFGVGLSWASTVLDFTTGGRTS